MAFDPSSAKPVSEGFDLSTATAVSPDKGLSTGELPVSNMAPYLEIQGRRQKAAEAHIQKLIAAEAQRRAAQNKKGAVGVFNPLSDIIPTAKGVGALVEYATTPIQSLWERALGQPISQLTGNRVSAPVAGDLASLLIPVGGEITGALKGEQLLRTGAKAADMSVSGFERAQKALQESQAALRADSAAKARQAAAIAAAKEPQGAVKQFVAPIRAALSPEAAQNQAQLELVRATTDAPNVISAAERGRLKNIVPGAQATTFEHTGDIGLGQLEQKLSRDNPTPFVERKNAQQTARLAALENTQATGDPTAVTDMLKTHLDDLSSSHDAAVDAAAENAKKTVSDLGGEGRPFDYGTDIQTKLSNNEAVKRAEAGDLWEQIDPENKLVGDYTSIPTDAEKIQTSVRTTAKPMEGEEAKIFNVAGTFDKNTPLGDVVAFRSRINAQLRMVLDKKSPEYARLVKLRTAVEDNIARHLGGQIADEGATVGKGTVDTEANLEDTVSANLMRWVEAHKNPEQFAETKLTDEAKNWQQARQPAPEKSADELAGERAQQLEQEAAAAKKAAADEENKALLETTKNNLAAAVTATKDVSNTFGVRPVRGIIAKRGSADQFAMPAGEVPAKVFKPGDGGFDSVQAVLNAHPDALPVLEDYAASSLREYAMNADGTLDPKKYATWVKNHEQALSAPGFENAKARFADAASATEALAEAAANRKVAMDAAQEGVLGKVMGAGGAQDVQAMVGSILNGQTAVADLKALGAKVRGIPEARAGLAKALVDHLVTKFTDVSGAISSNAFQTYLRDRREGLSTILSPDQMKNLDNIAADLARASKRADAQKAYGLPEAPPTSNISKIVNVARRFPGAALGVILGHYLGLGTVTGAATGAAVDFAVQGLRAKGITNVNGLLREALLDPKVAAEMLKTFSAKNGVTKADTTAQLMRMVRAVKAPVVASGVTGIGASTTNQPEQQDDLSLAQFQ